MNKLLENVGIRGLHDKAQLYVNDLPAVHDELLASVAYSEDLIQYYDRIAGTALETFQNEVIQALSCDHRFTDLMNVFPKATLNPEQIGAATVVLDTVQGIETRYQLANLSEYAKLASDQLLLFVKGPYQITVELELSLGGMLPEVIWRQELYGNDLGPDEIYLIDTQLPSEASVALNPARHTRLSLRVKGTGTLLPQTRTQVEPGIRVHDYKGSVLLGQPYASLLAEIRFDVGRFITRHYDRLSYAFANRVAARLLADKLSTPNRNIHTNSNRDDTKFQIDQLELQVKEHLKTIGPTLFFKAQSSEVQPFTAQPNIMIGGFV